MKHRLHCLSIDELQQLAAGQVPPALADRVEAGALPPDFVAARGLERIAAGGQPAWCGTFLIERTDDGRFVGACGFKGEPVAGRVEIGYGVAPACRNRGVASAAVGLLIGIARRQGAREVLAEVSPDNPASTRVVRRSGFEAIGSRVDHDLETVVQWLRRPDGGVTATDAAAPGIDT